LLILFLAGIVSSLSFGVDVSSWPITSVSATSKLVLQTDLIVPANAKSATNHKKNPYNWAENIFFVCYIDTRENSLQARVLRAGTEIVFTGEVTESIYTERDEGFKGYFLKVSQPEAIERVRCFTHSFSFDQNWNPGPAKPRDAKLGELISEFGGVAEFIMSEPVEIGNP